jgi:hypothetical protein
MNIKVFCYIFGTILLVGGGGCGVYMALADRDVTLAELVPLLVLHTIAMFLGLVIISVGQRYKR